MSAEPSTAPRLSTANVEAILQGFGPADWRRAETLAAVAVQGLAGWSPRDLLHESLTDLLDGSRTCPVGVPPMVMLASVMRSIVSNARQRLAASPVDPDIRVGHVDGEDAEDQRPTAYGELLLTPERVAEHRELLAAVEDLVKDDDELQLLLMAWAEGSRGDEAMTALGWDSKTHDAARKRLTRRLGPLATEWSSR